ncbi:3a8d509b-dccb-49d2-b2cc-32e38bcaae98-CDS [Sclerotinia trifoliorum]|uniref:3a8d509b-dccb-49d2-b2cc-32e38bcaae98-CDS n=1 Tax=Sclerotinia trifoliorum TaxID=28548 RepID=A0A8H2ZQT0_9HELO|nr:3a8d509b-dccb-49d2-b2cc-32e38bcaae98-CDS [Sclerotinia trifoliorum]
MESVNSNQGSTPTTPEPTLKSTPKNFVAQGGTSIAPPKTPPNTRTISPPRAPRPRQTFRTEGMWAKNGGVSMPTSSRTPRNIGSRFVNPAGQYQSNRGRDSRSVSPLQSRPGLYRARSALLHHPRSRPLAGAAPQLLPSLFINEGAVSTNNHSSGRVEVDMQYMNMLPIASRHPKEETAADVSSGLQDDENADSNLTEGIFNEYDDEDEEKDESGKKDEKEHDIWSWKC